MSVLFICTIHLGYASYTQVFEKKRDIFERKISEIAGQYIGIRYEFGGNFEKSGAVDNSHLFCLIYAQAAEQSGLVFAEYMTMDTLLKNTVEVERHDLKIGDLMVLINGLAAMIYKFENRDKFYLIYASGRRREVISFNSQNVVFEAYWLKNLKGYFRLSKSMLWPQN
ncbi:MAG: peptidoglycan endopeptidase [Desulfobacterales bacterium]